MPERTGGLRAVLSSARGYEACQRLVGSPRVRQELAARYLRPRPGAAVVDIGCGPGDIVEVLPGVRYVGFDPSEAYIAAAQRRFGDRATFFVDGVDNVDASRVGMFDLALAKGVLHHIDDAQAAKLFAFARDVLVRGGRLVTIDPCFSDGQSPVARFIIARDRGRNVRTEEAYRRLAAASFGDVTSHERHDLLRVPYTHVILECVRD